MANAIGKRKSKGRQRLRRKQITKQDKNEGRRNSKEGEIREREEGREGNENNGFKVNISMFFLQFPPSDRHSTYLTHSPALPSTLRHSVHSHRSLVPTPPHTYVFSRPLSGSITYYLQHDPSLCGINFILYSLR